MMRCMLATLLQIKTKLLLALVITQFVVQWVNDFLDKTISLADGSYSQLKSINIQQNKLEFTLDNGNHTQLSKYTGLSKFSRFSERKTWKWLFKKAIEQSIEVLTKISCTPKYQVNLAYYLPQAWY